MRDEIEIIFIYAVLYYENYLYNLFFIYIKNIFYYFLHKYNQKATTAEQLISICLSYIFMLQFTYFLLFIHGILYASVALNEGHFSPAGQL